MSIFFGLHRKDRQIGGFLEVTRAGLHLISATGEDARRQIFQFGFVLLTTFCVPPAEKQAVGGFVDGERFPAAVKPDAAAARFGTCSPRSDPLADVAAQEARA
jgi:hypothetical protein